ncbi:hypothetical protein FIU97_13775 [Roseivivax sp. THAF40]|uniref:hypothetical protein n=2 Tax=unclassified Roseivivax TaxID=2639302 RepID=UPI0012678412|nr:hypothetical protein [Roseivivax sp. THAF197b]QFS83812.1 hypothetical protein FIV09_13335 [Roseivivax sp. THAF197b]QFT47644.1 hypothetical protein FIU97_13775 [Roseivivax sp. THAF40]
MQIQTDTSLGSNTLGHAGAMGRNTMNHAEAGGPHALLPKTEGQAPTTSAANPTAQTPADIDALRLSSPTQSDHVAPPSIMQLKIAALQFERDADTRGGDIAPDTSAANPDNMPAEDPIGFASTELAPRPNDVTADTKS